MACFWKNCTSRQHYKLKDDLAELNWNLNIHWNCLPFRKYATSLTVDLTSVSSSVFVPVSLTHTMNIPWHSLRSSIELVWMWQIFLVFTKNSFCPEGFLYQQVREEPSKLWEADSLPRTVPLLMPTLLEHWSVTILYCHLILYVSTRWMWGKT